MPIWRNSIPRGPSQVWKHHHMGAEWIYAIRGKPGLLVDEK